MAISVLIVGDFCPRDRVLSLLGKKQIIDPEVSSIIKNSDISIVNLECPVVDNTCKPIAKEGPNLCSPASSIAEIKRAGFTIASLANNHILDYGDKGLKLTKDECNKQCILTVGAAENLTKAKETAYIQVGGQTLAIINCCEHEYSVAGESSAGSNPLTPIKQYYAIKEAKSKSDYVVVIVHGGIETYQLPTPRMKETYRFFVDAGADAVVNHHQHCYSGYEVYNEKPIFYGLGNFCFDWRDYSNDTWFEGFMVKLFFEKKIVSYEIYPYIQCKDEPKVRLMNEGETEKSQISIEQLNTIIQNDIRLHEELEKFMDSTEFDYKAIFEAYSGRIPMGLYRRNLLPSTITKKRVLKLLDYLECESHYERVIHYLKEQYKRMN